MDVAGRVSKEDEIPGEKMLPVDGRSVRREDLLVGDTRDVDADLAIDVLHETRAVEARRWRGTAPAVRRPQELLRIGERFLSAWAGGHARRGVCDLLRGGAATVFLFRMRGKQLVRLVEP